MPPGIVLKKKKKWINGVLGLNVVQTRHTIYPDHPNWFISRKEEVRKKPAVILGKCVLPRLCCPKNTSNFLL